ncbi:calcium-binding protein [Nostoc sp. 'Lobaria pulmonaria (5183) cyanobiont']|uniref:calcium-binding protein n=1 Tax=Nostoc sp. 'Lobaria pulmonaria (5183) cyanobiont' TaxID=1618022 RepID=UPI000CF335E0|nr:calcium-binding protein [Nostoc sp. 'Lobaria pulmonaria (5183) cyanobiont']AVH73243.1 hemolysin-type calcium-binding repeat-containing protein [Nostoc sp. 'Lobaria pulmonaria (5183) cyanobiont']
MSTQIGTPFSDNLLGGSGNDNLLGRKGDDNLFGYDGNDNLYGDEGNDNLFGGSGNDNLFGGSGNDNLFGSSGNDNLFGEKGDDVIFGSAGNDIIRGGDGIDTLDYTGLGQVITLFADRTKKGGGLGSDRLSEPPSTEIIIADPGFINVIDTSGTDLASLIDLGAERFDIFDVPEAITIKNFVNVIGSNQNDTIIGNELNNTLIGGSGNDFLGGSAGNDIYDGGDGIDTLDYTGLGQAITIFPDRIEKGNLGTDREVVPTEIEIVIGDVGFANTINASSLESPVSVDVDLSKESLTGVNISGVVNSVGTVKNFVNVIGTKQNDTIIGNKLNNIINGFGGRDTLFGGAGQDTFVLGEKGNVLYRNSGSEDLAIIKDFVSGEDKIQLTGNRSDYSFFKQGSSNFIALVGNGNGQFNLGTDEVIASLNSSFNIVNDLIFV